MHSARRSTIHPLHEYLAAFEAWRISRLYINFFSRLRITTNTWRVILREKRAESANFNARLLTEGLDHAIEYRPDRRIDIVAAELRKVQRDGGDQFGARHGQYSIYVL